MRWTPVARRTVTTTITVSMDISDEFYMTNEVAWVLRAHGLKLMAPSDPVGDKATGDYEIITDAGNRAFVKYEHFYG